MSEEEKAKVVKMIKTESIGWQTQGFVCRVLDSGDPSYPVIGLTCTNDQAILIKRLVGGLSRIQLHEMGFTESEAIMLHQMYDTI